MQKDFSLAGNILLYGFIGLTACKSSSVKNKNQLDTKPNIIFIYADDLDFDQMNVDCYPRENFPCFTGQKLAGQMGDISLPEGWDPPHFANDKLYTPNMNKLAKQGAHFTRFYITSAMCTPSRYSLLTGQYAFRSETVQKAFPPDTTASIEWNQYLSGDEDNIARQLKKAGYYTAIIGKWHNGEPEWANTREIYNEYKHDSLLLQKKLEEGQKIGCNFLMNDIGFDLATHMSFDNADKIGGHNLPWYTDAVLEFLERDHNKPFFLYFPLPVPHGWGGGSEFNKNLLLSPAGTLDKVPQSLPPIEDVYKRIREHGCSDRSIAFTWIDDCLGTVMKKLKENGMDKNTILVFTSDHQSRGKFSCYEGARVPLMIRWPGIIEPGSKVDGIYANIDIFPTVLEVAGIQPPESIDGKSFLGRIKGKEPDDVNRVLMLETSYGKAILKGDYKYIAYRPPQTVVELMKEDAAAADQYKERRVGWDGHENKNPGSRGMKGVRFSKNLFFKHYFDADQLYNLEQDVFEQNNLADEEKEKLRSMQIEMDKLLKNLQYPNKFGEFAK